MLLLKARINCEDFDDDWGHGIPGIVNRRTWWKISECVARKMKAGPRDGTRLGQPSAFREEVAESERFIVNGL
jgi:hypothetical protein